MLFVNLEDIKSREIISGYNAKFIHSENVTLAYWEIDKDALLPEHSHPHEQVATMLEGQFELTMNDETKILEPGTVAIIPSNVKHSGKAITDCKIMDVFYPIREEYR